MTRKQRDGVKERKQAERGRQAERLMKNPLLQEAFDKVREKIDIGWKGTQMKPSTAESRDNAYMLHRALIQLQAEIDSIIRTGKSAVKLLDIEEQARGGSSKPEQP